MDAAQKARRLQALASGREAETEVGRRLVGVGWTVLDRNWSGSGGELDLVVVRDARLRFVEVRARTGDDDVPVEETITPAKQRRLRRAAEAWLADHADEWEEIAFLLAFVDLSVDPWSIRWIDDPF